ncbi:hypothetical protein MTP99_002187 [Tenebrio molitor]|nr:hypothetical protein MTP99_002187 [Tenebrio molitor]
MADLIINSHLCQLVSEPTRFRLNQTPSTLDLIISSDDNSLTNLKYLSPIGISDHVTLGIELQIYSCPRLKTVSFERTVVEWAAVNQHISVVDWNLLLSNTSMTHNWKVFKTTLQDTIAQHTTRARTRYEASIANSKDTKHFHKHIRTQLSGPVGTPQVSNMAFYQVNLSSLTFSPVWQIGLGRLIMATRWMYCIWISPRLLIGFLSDG